MDTSRERPKYETPRVVMLGELARALGGGDCNLGSMAPGKCGLGNSPSVACESGNNAKISCKVGTLVH